MLPLQHPAAHRARRSAPPLAAIGLGAGTLLVAACPALAERHGFTLPREMLRIAINAEFTTWERPLQDGDEVVFLPPVAGG